MDFIEIVKYLHQDIMLKNPPEFTQKLITISRLDSVLAFERFLDDDEKNKNVFLTYVMVAFNWIMKSVLEGNPDLYELTNLQFKVSVCRGRFPDELSNHYMDMIHVFLSSVALYYCDKSNEALAEFNQTIGTILARTANFWMHDFREEYMASKAPESFLKKAKTVCSCDTTGSCDCK